MLIVIIGITAITLVLLLEIGVKHITKQDIATLIGFVAGMGSVIAFMRGGKKK